MQKHFTSIVTIMDWTVSTVIFYKSTFALMSFNPNPIEVKNEK